jgi:hypothetical protein
VTTEGLDRLRRAMEDGGLVERRDDSGVTPESFGNLRLSAQLEVDDRASNERCVICCGPMHPQRKDRVAEGQYAHGICASVEQDGEWVLRHWLALPFEVRRRRVIQHFGVDPFTCEQMPVVVEWLTFHNDVDGRPSTMDVERSLPGTVPTLGVPRCWWSFATERGWS